jgi:hypothetical protein
MPTDQPNPPDQPPTGPPLQTRELLASIVLRIRQDLARVKRLARDLGVNIPTPPEVDQAIVTLQDWTVELMRTGRPHRPPGP